MNEKEIYASWPFKVRYLRPECWALIKDYILRHEITSVLEFGSGVSTILLNSLGVDVVSYETDSLYLRRVKSYNLANVEFNLWDNQGAYITKTFGLSLVDGIVPRDKQFLYAMAHSRYIAIDDFSDEESSREIYPLVEGLTRLDNAAIKMAIFRKLKQ